ncbi:MAG TPA: HlyD family efflux transporter periplasmic adaptor subunit, partial [Candidatus Saccharimonadales bacterium]|nr:HlyD family efflux transporter periplasmic adaptor subunit [Candidatus Saccharimonadales bacterium]
QLAAANAQLNSSLRNSQYQASGDNPPAKLSDLQKDIALQQLDLQQKSLELGKDISKLQLSLAQVMAAQMAPAAPFAGTIERINVRVGQSVNPGTTLLTLTGNKSELTAVAQVPGSIARAVSIVDPADFEIDGKVYQVKPTYISGEATDGSLYSIIFTLDREVADLLADNGFVNIHVPVGVVSDDGSTLVPLDAVHQTQDSTYIFTADVDRATSKTVTLGALQGKFVKVVSGLGANDRVILSRNIVNGDKISVK